MSRPSPIIFLHLQKTGGTSLRRVVRDVFYRVARAPTRKKDGTWTALTPSQKCAYAWYGHMTFGWHTLLPNPTPYLTLVRDPVAREVSRFRSRSYYRDEGLTPALSVEREWNMVYQLSGIPKNELGSLGEAHIKIALANLKKHFLYVGDTSRMDELGLWLKDTLRWPIVLPLPHENKAESEITVTEEEVEALKTHPFVQLDQKLYNKICELGPYPSGWKI